MDYKVIVIKLPSDLQDRILSFPFLHALREKFPEADIHFISPKNDIEILNLLPFHAYYHPYDERDLNNIFHVHRFCATAKVYNVDLFISLTNSFSDACLGLGLRAKHRLGFSDNWKSLVLTHKTLRPVGHHVVEDYFELFKVLIGAEVNSRIRVMARDLPPIINDFDNEPYIAINLSPLRNAVIEDEWFKLLNIFQNQRIVLFSSEEPVRAQMLMDPFMASLPATNKYVNFWYKNWIELSRMLSNARGVISYSGAAGALSSYVGTKTLLLYENEDPQKTGPFYFLADVSIMGINNPTLVNSTTTTKGSMNERKTFKMEEVAIKAQEFFKL